LDHISGELLRTLDTLRPTPRLVLGLPRLLGMLASADAWLRVPLHPGTYRAFGSRVEVAEGTTVEARLLVTEGAPSCTMIFHPPLTAAGAVQVHGARLHLMDHGNAEFAAILGSPGAPESVTDPHAAPLDLAAADLSRARGGGTLSLQAALALLGDVTVTPEAGSSIQFKVEGGEVALNGVLRVREALLCNALSRVTLQNLQCRASLRVHLENPRTLRGQLRNLTCDVHGLSLQNPARTALLEVERGRVVSSRLVVVEGRAVGTLKLTGSNTNFSAPCGRGTLQLEAGHMDADLKLTRHTTHAQLRVSEATGTAENLNTTHGPASLEITRLQVTGDASVATGASHGGVELSVRARSVVADLKRLVVKTHAVQVRTGRTRVRGEADLKITPDGSHLHGTLHCPVALEAVTARGDNGRWRSVVRRGATVDGILRALTWGAGRTPSLHAVARIHATLQNQAVRLPRLETAGDVLLRGELDVLLRDGELLLTSEDATATSEVKYFCVSLGREGLLNANHGSRILLPLRQIRLTGDPEQRRLVLGDGGELDLVVRDGHVRLGGRSYMVTPQSRALIGLRGLTLDGAAPHHVRASMAMEVSLVEHRDAAGEGAGHEALGLLTCEELTLHRDGALEARGLRVGINAHDGLFDDVAVGVSADGAQAASPLRFLDHLWSGTLDADVALEGQMGKGVFTKVSFLPGTRLILHARVQDGRVVARSFKGQLTQVGYGPLGIAVRGFHLDDDGTVRLELQGPVNIAAPGLERLPTNVLAFVQHILNGNGAGPQGNDAVKRETLRFQLRDAALREGRIPLGKGWVHVSDKSRVSIEGTLNSFSVMGTLDIVEAHLIHKRGVLTGGHGSADVGIAYENVHGSGVIKVMLTQLNLDAHNSSAAQVQMSGSGALHGATLAITAAVALDQHGFPVQVTPSDVELRAEQLEARRD